ncbi:MAG: fused response regulator/phosphatase [Gammaproteobacteria bacterium]|nr:fused response regulator/phosphatase [Gammaproteobacteria bacterium]
MKILVVDDIDKNRSILDRYLTAKGFDVITASSGAESIVIVHQEEIDLVLMDVKMPDMDGYEATRQIKDIASENYLPVIFVTALSEEEALEEALAAGGDDFISKPISFGVLLSKINAHSRIRELHIEVNRKNNELITHNIRLNREHELVSHFFDQAQKFCFYDEKIVRSFSIPMSTFSGDTILVVRRPHGGLAILIGDFTGHGLSAAVGTLPVSQVFFQMVEENAFIGDIARELNKQVNLLLPVEMFFAASIIELSAKGDRLMIWHGGMPNAYLLDQKTNELTTIKSAHLPLGVREQEEFDDSVQLFYVNQHHKLVSFTDGLSEAENTDLEMIEADMIEDAIVGSDDIIKSVMALYQSYSEGIAQSDDVSIIELSCLPLEAEIKPANPANIKATVPWNIELVVNDYLLKNDVVQNIIELIGDYTPLKDHKGIIHTLLTELYSNALDHGILGLEGDAKNSVEAFDRYYLERHKRLDSLKDSCLTVKLSYLPEEQTAVLKIIMSHNGRSFNLDNIKAADDDMHGRGMDLINAICEEVDYSDEGRCVSVAYRI